MPALRTILSAMSVINWCGIKLAVQRSSDFRAYLSETLRRYEEYAAKGLPGRNPIAWLEKEGGYTIGPTQRVQLPSRIQDDGGTSLAELATLAAAAQVVKPRRVFEIGTFNGRTSATFIMNSPAEAVVYSLDLPLSVQDGHGMIESDIELVKQRRLGAWVYEHQLEDRFRQLLCDSLDFDPLPYRDSIELGFVDGAHARKYVENDTEKMAIMMAPRGLAFWHDYGGRGRFGPLTEYLEELGRQIRLFRVPGTTLAWTSATELRKLRRTT
jgi:Methyltransferase domain